MQRPLIELGPELLVRKITLSVLFAVCVYIKGLKPPQPADK